MTATDPIADPGVYHNLPAEQYHASPRLSRSRLAAILKSPAHFQAYAPRATQAMRRGSAIHAAVLEPDRFEHEYVFPPTDKIDRRTKAGRAEWDAFLAEANGRTIVGWDPDAGRLYKDDAETVWQAQRAVAAVPEAQLLLEGFPEVTSTCDIDGVRLRSRTDNILRVKGGLEIVELKSAEDAGPEAFSRQIANLLYHFQAAFYTTVVERAWGETVKAYRFVVVETSPPYDVALYTLGGASLVRGMELFDTAFCRYRECCESGTWPGRYADGLQTLDAPNWDLGKEEEGVLTIGGEAVTL